jgi:[methyl-Co(III) methanol-specific corrinoid protein]:coenzyme M methyltransferase
MKARAAANSREDVLALLAGQQLSRLPCFSGLVSVSEPGLAQLGLTFGEVHGDATRMARAAASSYRLCGLESAVVPLDMCVEAEALGSIVDFRQGESAPAYPIVEQYAADSPEALELPSSPEEILERGRVPVVLEAIRLLTEDVGQEIVIGAWVPGPMTLAMYLLEPDAIMASIVENSDFLKQRLESLTLILAEVAGAYREAGADFITIHEMGGSPGYLGPATFKRLVLPQLQRLVASIPQPCVLSVCGRTARALDTVSQAGATALSVDELSDVSLTRSELGRESVLFGNINPVDVLAYGREDDVGRAVREAAAAGIDAIWPGCDLWPATPLENLRAMVGAAQQAGSPDLSGNDVRSPEEGGTHESG